jgi:RHS repeat-associated protein
MKIFTAFTKQLTACLLILFAINAHAVRTTTYYHTDGLGSVVAASDESGNLLWRKSYAPYGEQIDGNTDNEPISYTGKKHDDVTGLTYFGARYYDPRIGRFMATDPVHFMESNPVSFNRYAYVNNNPYKYVDPDGKILFLAPIAIFILKEVAAEGLSIYTGGATDLLSTRRMAMKAGKFAKNKLAEAVQTANRDAAIKVALEKAHALKKAEAARDATADQLKRKHATYAGGHKDGKVVSGCSSNPAGCAEDDIARQLGSDAQMTGAKGYRRNGATGEVEYTDIPVCTSCQSKYSRSQFPANVKYDSGGAWSE